MRFEWLQCQNTGKRMEEGDIKGNGSKQKNRVLALAKAARAREVGILE